MHQKNRMSRFFRNAVAFGAGLGASVVAGMASAAVETAGITTAIGDAATAVGVIGAAVVLVIVGIKVFKWIGRSI